MKKCKFIIKNLWAKEEREELLGFKIKDGKNGWIYGNKIIFPPAAYMTTRDFIESANDIYPLLSLAKYLALHEWLQYPPGNWDACVNNCIIELNKYCKENFAVL